MLNCPGFCYHQGATEGVKLWRVFNNRYSILQEDFKMAKWP